MEKRRWKTQKRAITVSEFFYTFVDTVVVEMKYGDVTKIYCQI